MPVTRLGNNKFLPGIDNFLPGNAKIPLRIGNSALGNGKSDPGNGNSDPGNAVSHPGISNSDPGKRHSWPGKSISDLGKRISRLEKRLSEACATTVLSERCENSAFLRQYPIALSLLRANHIVRFMSTLSQTRVPPTVLSSALIALSAVWFISAYAFYVTNKTSKDGVFGAPVWALLFLTLVPLSTLFLAPWMLRARRADGQRLRVIDYCGLMAGGAPFVFVGILFLVLFAAR